MIARSLHILMLIVFSFTITTHAQVSGSISTDTVWGDSVIIVSGNLTVDAGVTLSILPGAEVKFLGYYSITVNGALSAVGEPGNPITFTSGQATPAAGNWNGIIFTSSSGNPSSEISYCRILYAQTALYYSGVQSSYVNRVSNSIIDQTSNYAVRLDWGSRLEMYRDTILNFVSYGIYALNPGTMLTLDSGCVVRQVIPSKLRTGRGIYMFGGNSLTMRQSSITQCAEGVYAYSLGNSEIPIVQINLCEISGNNTGVFISTNGSAYSSTEIQNNDIKNNFNWNLYIGGGANPSQTELYALNNYWGTTDGVGIASKIYDYTDNSGVAYASYLPFLNASKDSGGTSTSGNYKTNSMHEDQTWTQIGSPYVVLGTITVEQSKTLTIEPGVEVRFQTGGLVIDGRLLAGGESGLPVVLTSNRVTKATGDWTGLTFRANGVDSASVLRHTRVEYTTTGISLYNINESTSLFTPLFENVSVSNTSSYGIFSENSVATFRSGLIDNTGSFGMHVYANSKLTLRNTTVRNFATYGIYIYDAATTMSMDSGCVVTQVVPAKLRTGRGIYITSGASVVVGRTTITQCNEGIYVYNNNSQNPSLTISQSNIASNNTGIWQGSCCGYSFAPVMASNNDIKNNISWNVYVSPGGSNPAGTEYSMIDNYWGTSDGVSVAAKIHDYTDNGGSAYVNYLPFLNASKDSGGFSVSNYKANIIHQDETWTLAQSPYVVLGTVTVEQTRTLTIEPGVEVRFQTGGLIVNGRLLVNGDIAQQVVFTSNKTSKVAGDWSGLTFNANGVDSASVLTHARVEYAGTGISVNSINEMTSLYSPSFENVSVLNTSSYGVFASNAVALFRNGSVDNTGNVGMYLYGGSKITLRGITVKNYTTHGVYAFDPGTTLTMDSGCVVTQIIPAKLRTGRGVYIYRGAVATVSLSTITQCAEGIYAYNDNGQRPILTISASAISNNNSGIWHGSSSSSYLFPLVTASGNDIKNNINWNVYVHPVGNNPGGSEYMMTDNYWGTTDGVTIASKIHDYTDNGNAAYVNYLPFLNASKDSGGTSTSGNYKANIIHQDQVWTQAGSPYVVLGAVTVEQTKTLTIERGVEVRFQTGGLTVNGRLLSNGVSEQQVVFTSNRVTKLAGDWNGLTFNANGVDSASVLHFTRVEYASTGLSVNNINELTSLYAPSFRMITVQNTSSHGVFVNNSVAAFRGGSIQSVGDRGIWCYAGAQVTLRGMTIKDFANYGLYVQNNTTSVEMDSGCVITQTMPSRIRTGSGIYVYQGGDVTVRQATITNCNYGLQMYNDNNESMSGSLYNSVLAYNNSGIFTDQYNTSYSFPQLSANSCDIKNNVNWAVFIDPSGVNPSGTNHLVLNSYWGSADSAEIAGKIYDYTDNAGSAKITFLPIASDPAAMFGQADVSRDGRTDGADLATMGATFGRAVSDSGFNSNADLNTSGRVDGFDLAILGVHFGDVGIRYSFRALGGTAPRAARPEDSIAIVSIKSASSYFNAGDTVIATVSISQVSQLFAFSSDVQYDATALEFIRAAAGGFLSRDGAEPVFTLAKARNGKVILGVARQVSTAVAPSGEGELVSIVFIATKTGETSTSFALDDIGLLAPDGTTEYPFLHPSSPTRTDAESVVPNEFALVQNYPNPFNPSTQFEVHLPVRSAISLRIFDLLGREVAIVAEEEREAGVHRFVWNTSSSGLASGFYVYRLYAKESTDSKGRTTTVSRKLLLLK